MTLKIYSGLKEIAPPYEYFLIDLWGVVHNGEHLLPGVKDCLEHLQDIHKKILFLTNSPRPGYVLEQHLEEIGLSLTQGNHVYSSGDACIAALKEKWGDQPYYFLGEEIFHASIIKALPGPMTKSIEDAKYILITSLPGTTPYVLEEGLRHQLPLVCANPDKSAIHGTTAIACPGSVADEYEKKGGKVYYYGKPYSPIYEQALKALGSPDKKKVLAIGDGLFTDIQGATQMGLDCVFVQSGIHHALSLEHVKKLCTTHPLKPTYLLERLSW